MVKKLSHHSMKQRNRLLVLNMIRNMGPLSRAEISRLTGLTKSTVSEIISFLISKGLVRQVGTQEKRGVGRRGILLSLDPSNFYIVGYDIGTLTSRVVLTDLNGEIIKSVKFKTSRGDEIVDQIRNGIEELIRGYEDKTVGIGIGAPGMIDHIEGEIVHSPNLRIRNLNLVKMLASEFPGKVIVLEHNVKLMMIAEMRYGKAKDRESVLLVNLGPGIGSAFSSDGKIFRGSNNFAGEIGHISVVPDGDVCSCGKRGCLETVAAAWGIVRRYERISGKKISGEFNAEEVAERARGGDAAAVKVFEEAGKYLGMVVAYAVNILDPEIVLIAGGLSNAWNLMKDAFMKAFQENILVVLRGKVEISLSDLGEYSTALGAATLALEKFFEKACS